MNTVTKHAEAFKTRVLYVPSCIIAMMMVLSATRGNAQINPFQSVYFQNRYLGNPSIAGLEKGLDINLGYQQQWSSFPGASKSQSLTAEYQASEKVGLGLNIKDDQQGLFRQTHIMGTYAYHLPLSDQTQKLNFGLSVGINDPRINYSSIIGDPTDSEILEYNNRKPYLDGDLGVSYTSNNLFAEVALPNANTNLFNRNGQDQNIDQTVVFTAISYKFNLNETGAFSLEPLAAYRVIKGYTNIFDAGFNFKMNDYYLDLQAVYHSNDNFGIGVVFNQPAYAISFNYNIFTGQITTYTSGDFELGIKLKLFK